jgi:hypothetical protein
MATLAIFRASEQLLSAIRVEYTRMPVCGSRGHSSGAFGSWTPVSATRRSED